MDNKWTALSESLPDFESDVLFQKNSWRTFENPKGIRMGFLGTKNTIITTVADEAYVEYITEIIKITPDTAKQIKWKLIE